MAGAAKATATVGAGVGAAAMMPVPPAMPTELAAEVTGVAAIELKLIAELHEVYGVRPAGTLAQRSTVYLNSWSQERGIEATKPSTVSAAMNSRMKRELRQRIVKRTVRNLPNLMPFLVGAAVGAVMNRRDTRKLAARIRDDLRKVQVPWDELPPLPALERPTTPSPSTRWSWTWASTATGRTTNPRDRPGRPLRGVRRVPRRPERLRQTLGLTGGQEDVGVGSSGSVTATRSAPGTYARSSMNARGSALGPRQARASSASSTSASPSAAAGIFASPAIR